MWGGRRIGVGNLHIAAISQQPHPDTGAARRIDRFLFATAEAAAFAGINLPTQSEGVDARVLEVLEGDAQIAVAPWTALDEQHQIAQEDGYKKDEKNFLCPPEESNGVERSRGRNFPAFFALVFIEKHPFNGEDPLEKTSAIVVFRVGGKDDTVDHPLAHLFGDEILQPDSNAKIELPADGIPRKPRKKQDSPLFQTDRPDPFGEECLDTIPVSSHVINEFGADKNPDLEGIFHFAGGRKNLTANGFLDQFGLILDVLFNRKRGDAVADRNRAGIRADVKRCGGGSDGGGSRTNGRGKSRVRPQKADQEADEEFGKTRETHSNDPVSNSGPADEHAAIGARLSGSGGPHQCNNPSRKFEPACRTGRLIGIPNDLPFAARTKVFIQDKSLGRHGQRGLLPPGLEFLGLLSLLPDLLFGFGSSIDQKLFSSADDLPAFFEILFEHLNLFHVLENLPLDFRQFPFETINLFLQGLVGRGAQASTFHAEIPSLDLVHGLSHVKFDLFLAKKNLFQKSLFLVNEGLFASDFFFEPLHPLLNLVDTALGLIESEVMFLQSE